MSGHRNALVLPVTALLLMLGVAPAAHAVPHCYSDRATIVGTAGDDRILGTPRRDVILGLGGDDLILGGTGSDTICGGAGHDRISGGGNSDDLSGGSGRDRVSGGSGHDLLGGLGQINEPGNDVFLGGPGWDDLYGRGGHDLLRAGSGPDIVSGDRGGDTIFAGADDDGVIGGPGNDQLGGGPGVDYVFYGHLSSGVTVDLAARTAVGEGLDRVHGIEDVYGTSLNDVLRGDGADNLIVPWLGDDLVDGGQGRDHVSFYPGLDGPSGVTVDLAAGTASGEGSDRLVGIEDITGSRGDDVIRGDAGPNLLEGESGSDTLEGREGDDVLAGMVVGYSAEYDGTDIGDGGPHVNGDVCDRIEQPSNCETIVPRATRAGI